MNITHENITYKNINVTDIFKLNYLKYRIGVKDYKHRFTSFITDSQGILS